MSDYTAIVNVGRSLKKLLLDNFSADTDDIIKSIKENQITLSSPDEMDDGTTLSLFLYQVTEDAFLKNQPLKASNSDESQRPPIYLDLFYMVTVNTKSADTGQKAENDLKILGKITQIFNDNPILKGPLLQEPLSKDNQDLKLIFNSLSLDDINKVWNAISKSKPYKTTLYYEVTPVRIESTNTFKVSRVAEKDICIGEIR